MENPFFKNYWNTSRPRYSSSTKSPSPKVVSIPVHFVGSEKIRSTAALKIQKVFRGFLVRKSMKKIIGIKCEVDAIERRVSESENVDLIRRNEKERLKINEMLMALLIRLDSVRGVDSGVRECRKSVIRKTIMLQEKVDAIVSGGDQSQESVDLGGETTDQALEIVDRADSSVKSESVTEADDQTLKIQASADSLEDFEIADSATGQPLEMNDLVEAENQNLDLQGDSIESTPEKSNSVDNLEELPEKSQNLIEGEEDLKIQASADSLEDFEIADSATGQTLEMNDLVEAENQNLDLQGDSIESTPEKSNSVDNLEELPEKSQNLIEGEEDLEESSEKFQNCVEEDLKESFENIQTLVEEEKKEKDEMEIQQPDLIQANQGVEESNRGDNSKALMERMIGENEKLMGLVTELCERNMMQTQLLTSLSQRVENLERTFMSERLRRKKKRLAAATGEKLENSPDSKKCGKK